MSCPSKYLKTNIKSSKYLITIRSPQSVVIGGIKFKKEMMLLPINKIANKWTMNGLTIFTTSFKLFGIFVNAK